MQTNIRVLAAMAYGLLIAVLAILDVPQLGLIAIIGAVLLGAMWVATGRTAPRTRTRTRTRD